ncbi:ankyrin repeat protein [Moumouvirus australiensis]|uniref:Ankyrin repeat protein n=1 Tax=Moumouvirus australiensis TaxID=2109587 RepID=A0A2P1EMP7_9VIRU|nr:ankyrin repeat protein [Moumouvirus australiensis]AVL95151.1 ankyrin repeat protein [Moumouvirus australiensis]
MAKVIKKHPINKNNDKNKLIRLIISQKRNPDGYQKIKDYLQNNKDEINYVNKMGWSPLIIACTFGFSNIEIIKLLLEFGADINIKNKNGDTVLMTSLMLKPNNLKYNNIEVIKILIEAGADINMRNNQDWTALMLACRCSNINNNIEIVKLLLKAGADINIKNKFTLTALELACKFSNSASNIETIKLLLEAGANINSRINALILSAYYNNSNSNIEIVKLLLESGVDINSQNNTGETALITASCSGSDNIETIKLLLELGVNPNIQDKKGRTALMYVCQNRIINNFDTIKLLLHHNAKLDIKDELNKSALYYASTNVENDMESLLLLLNYSSESDYICGDDENIFSGLKNKYFKQCLKIVNEIAHQKLNMKFIHKQIKHISNKFLYNPNSIRSRLIILKLNLENNPIEKCITLENLELFDYLGIYDLDYLEIKLYDALKYLD